ncbi:MAG: DUF4276 family protein, partial [Gemmatimonadetes bacterium]|nr:DUF4276 family protein [Gemmatimonadota bacterium]
AVAAAFLNALCPIAINCGVPALAVVIKNRRYENWLISDPAAFKRMRKRFRLSKRQVQSIEWDKADSVDGFQILSRAARGAAYSKTADAMQILNYTDPDQMALNSRSFRRFLRVLGHPNYLDQSRSSRPAA